MSSSKRIQVLVLAALMGTSGAALAKGTHPQNHHCKLADGTMDMKKTHKECTAAKGTWAKDAPAATTPAPAPKDAAPPAAKR